LQDGGYALNRQVEGRPVVETVDVRQDHDADLLIRQQEHVGMEIADISVVF
jgi:hypothetical protein